jgi:F-type H+-transporting ATPase subunit b
MADLTLAILAAGRSGRVAEAAEPLMLGCPAEMGAASMAVLILVALALKVPGVLTKGLDGSDRRNPQAAR